VVRKGLKSITICAIVFLGVCAAGSELDEANRLFVLEKYDDAVKLYEEIASGGNEKEAAEALFGNGRAYQMLGEWKAARGCFERLLRERPDSELVLRSKIQIGQCEIKLGDLRKALVVFDDVERKYGEDEASIEATYNAANLNAGFFGDQVRNIRAAIEGYRRVLDSDAGKRYATQSHFGLGQCYMLLRDYPRAIEAFQLAMKDSPNTIWARFARDQMADAMRGFGSPSVLRRQDKAEELWPGFPRGALTSFEAAEWFARGLPGSRPSLRIHAVGFFTQSPDEGAGAVRVFYSTPTIYYRNHVFQSDRGTVDRANRSVVCMGNVKCNDDAVPPRLTITSGTLTLDLGKNKAVFSRDVRFERREGAALVQQLMVGELHLLLDSGKIEVPAE